MGSLALIGTGWGHKADLAKPGRLGPILRERTTLAQMEEWFGEPSSRRVRQVGCVKAIKVRWGRRLSAIAGRSGEHLIAQATVKRRTIESAEHGELTLHTRKGLRVGDSERKLQRLYPKSEPVTHAGHTHYRLKTGHFGQYLMGKAVDGTVVALEMWPYEFC